MHLSSARTPAIYSSAAQDAFVWNTPEGHQSPTRTPFNVADIPEAFSTSKRKAEHSANIELSTSIDTT
ncbi:hypothetical protein V6N13_135858 [Hibiscus sabdariffa]